MRWVMTTFGGCFLGSLAVGGSGYPKAGPLLVGVVWGSIPEQPRRKNHCGHCTASSSHPVLQMEVDDGEEPDLQDLPSDGEFEGEGDYEEGFFAEWWQEPNTKGDKADEGS